MVASPYLVRWKRQWGLLNSSPGQLTLGDASFPLFPMRRPGAQVTRSKMRLLLRVTRPGFWKHSPIPVSLTSSCHALTQQINGMQWRWEANSQADPGLYKQLPEASWVITMAS